MTVERRAGLGLDDELPVDQFAPKQARREDTPPTSALRSLGEGAEFHSREPAAKKKRRGRRTGRNVQFTAKASQATINRIYAITDDQGWLVADTLERMVSALEKELASSTDAGGQDTGQGD